MSFELSEFLTEGLINSINNRLIGLRFKATDDTGKTVKLNITGISKEVEENGNNLKLKFNR